MQGPKPVNIGGTGRRRKQRNKAAEIRDGSGHRADGGRRETGKLGEDIALEHLLQMGYKLLERNWYCRHKEVDLIMEGEDGLHIVEVRTRHEPVAMEPELTVDRHKQRYLEAAAAAWLRKGGEYSQVHFDIASIVLDKSGNVIRYSLIHDAFLPMGQCL